jgi:hypothetical protein
VSINRKRFLACALAPCVLTPPPSSGHGLEAANGSGVVSLSGTTGSRREADRAVAIARGTGGVLRVKNGIVVQARGK